jgi:uncharacterized membrane protein
MSKFVVVVFADEAKAYEGTRALKELDAEGSLSLYGMAVVARDAGGKVSVKQAAGQGPMGTGVGALAGGLIGLLGGPVGAVAGMAGGALLGGLGDLFNLGVTGSFVDAVSQNLIPGKTAVVAEVDEDWVTPLDSRMEAIGGTVLREWRSDVEDELHTREVNARKAEVAELRAEFAQSRGEARAKLQARITTAQTKLQDATDRARTWIEQRREETDAKVKAVQEQAAAAKAGAKAKFDKRVAGLRASNEQRSAKLKQALELTKEALAA